MIKKGRKYDIEVVKKIDSIEFYKQIYNKGCNSFWIFRPIYYISTFIGIYLLIMGIGRGKALLFLVVLILCIPVILYTYRTMNGRTNKYLKFLQEMKLERSLDNEVIDQLLEDISYLKIKYRKERDSLFKTVLSICKIAVFPITAAVFTAALDVSEVAATLLMFISTITITLTIAFWLDHSLFESFKNLGIKNLYLISEVEKELEFMKQIKKG